MIRARTVLGAFFLAALAGILVAALPTASGRAPEPDRVTVQRQAYLMGTVVTLAVRAPDRAPGLRALDAMLATLESVEEELSTWRPDSLLSALNRQAPGAPHPAPDPLCGLLLELRSWHAATGGAFDPAIGSLIEVWGLRGGGRLAATAELRAARARAGLQHLQVTVDPCRIERRRDVLLDAGAFGKGAAIERLGAGDQPAGGSAWMVDLGGQVAVGGSEADPWSVALAHPTDRTVAALELELAAGSLATSGGSVRDLEVDGVRLGHVLDPRSGRPVSRAESVTVWHPRALVADILSTALYVMGVEEGLAWAEARELAVCFLVPEADGSALHIRATSAFQKRFLPAMALDPYSH